MAGNRQSPQTPIRFGSFEADLHSRELRKHGIRMPLRGQAFQILQMLLERPGILVTREELQQALWPSDTFVDFEHGVNSAVNDLREALGDPANEQRLIETLPRRGYRFIAQTESPPTGQMKVRTSNRTRWMKISALILVGVACAAVLTISYHKIFPRVTFAPAAPVPFTDYPGRAGIPTFSPDGSQIAFEWNGDPATEATGGQKQDGAGSNHLYVKTIHSENLLRLTQHPSAFIDPAWSPDGTQIAFYRFSAARVWGANTIDDTGIYIIPALGGPERKLRSTQGGWGGITWSADGKWIAYPDHTAPVGVIHPTDPNRIFVLSLDTLESRQIPHADECLAEMTPKFSHSGDRLAYICLLKVNDNEFGIYTGSWPRGSPKLVSRFMAGPDLPFGLAWTADDKRLIVSRPHFGGDELDEVALTDGTLTKLPFGQGTDPAISAKGDRLAYSVLTQHINIWRKDLWHTETAGVKLMSSTYEQKAPQYSPDGKHIAFSSNRGGAMEIWMSDADGTNLVRMSDSKSSKAGSPRWSPDSLKLAFDSRESGHPEVYIVDISERLPRKLITNVSDATTPSWSHDGKWLYFEATSEQRIFRCPAGGGDAEALSPDAGSYPFESDDGETVFFVSPPLSEESFIPVINSPSLRMVSVKQPGTSLAVKGVPVLSDWHEYTVVPGGIYFIPANASNSIQYFDFASKKARKIFDFEEVSYNGLSVSPDGRWILYTRAEGDCNIMLVEGFR